MQLAAAVAQVEREVLRLLVVCPVIQVTATLVELQLLQRVRPQRTAEM
jgi:hypothetical protein